MELHSLNDVLNDQLNDIHSAEVLIIKALPRIIKAAFTPSFKRALQEHLSETENQIQRLDAIGEAFELRLKDKKCIVMDAILRECDELIARHKPSVVLDAALIGEAIKIEQYESAEYRTASTLAAELRLKDVARLLAENLDEEERACEEFLHIAEEEIYPKAGRAQSMSPLVKLERGGPYEYEVEFFEVYEEESDNDEDETSQHR